MPRTATKTALLTFRVTPEVRAALELAAEKERRSLTNMLEVIVLDWTAAHGNGKASARVEKKKAR